MTEPAKRKRGPGKRALLIAPPGQCAYCDRRRAKGKEAVDKFRLKTEKPE